ncbi:NUDIX domain-containing protein [Psychrilyobacter atlanticus]|uniref:NUDIX domain-containing protein n=1 Tax=Psychrilyobacter atlanticus TaxID=271091 RepID=UPI0004126669|nr:NUDIX domain-containing protein [Psychrilyobacter atlanticus]
MKSIRIRVCGILEKDDELLLVKHIKNNNEYYLLPGGGVDHGEDFKTALKREFMEECNLDVEVEDMVFISEGIAPNGGRHIVNVYFKVSYIGGDLQVGLDGSNLIGVEYIKKSELENVILYPNTKKELKEYFESENKGIKYLGNRWE